MYQESASQAFALERKAARKKVRERRTRAKEQPKTAAKDYLHPVSTAAAKKAGTHIGRE
jgi:hypothetical protein